MVGWARASCLPRYPASCFLLHVLRSFFVFFPGKYALSYVCVCVCVSRCTLRGSERGRAIGRQTVTSAALVVGGVEVVSIILPRSLMRVNQKNWECVCLCMCVYVVSMFVCWLFGWQWKKEGAVKQTKENMHHQRVGWLVVEQVCDWSLIELY